MAEVAAKLKELKLFKSKSSDEDDYGEQIDFQTIGGAGHGTHKDDGHKQQLRVSQALREFIVDKKIMSKSDAGFGDDALTPALQKWLGSSHIYVPPEFIDRSHPLPEYWISSSHNTYLLAHQLYGSSSAEAYETAIKTGSRCVEIDVWDNDENLQEPKVTHGYTLVSNVPFRAVCETIRDCLDEEIATSQNDPTYSPTAIMISLENHCSAQGQMRLVEIMREIWGDRMISKAVREEGHREQAGSGEHVTLQELGPRIAVIVEYHFAGEKEDSDSDSDDETDEEEEKKARKEYKEKKKASAASVIIPELAELGVYAQSVKPIDNSWYETDELLNGPHHHLINVSESGLSSHLPEQSVPVSRHNSKHLMRVFPKGTRISSTNLKPTQYWGIGAQICALNWQTFGASNQLNHALFAGSDGYVLKPPGLRMGGNGMVTTGRKKKLILHVAGATDIPLHEDREAESIKPYLTCTLFHPGLLGRDPPKRKTAFYKPHKIGFLHKGENPVPTDPIWDETLEWEYDDAEVSFLRMLIKSDDSWARNPMFAVAAVRLQYVVSGWTFVPMLDLKGHETKCTLLVKFEMVDA
ncbi:phosphatidylinositol-specific phospholipase c, X domain-containing protein [Sarocladium implicatum]|nr:phosphatidylinositol-specific phospholipase c, X domain-containing protein [Sarocladium implicatum]